MNLYVCTRLRAGILISFWLLLSITSPWEGEAAAGPPLGESFKGAPGKPSGEVDLDLPIEPFGSALKFYGEHFAVSDHQPSLILTNSLTLEAWVLLHLGDTGWSTKQVVSGPWYGLAVTDSGCLDFYVPLLPGPFYVFSPEASVSYGIWTHIAGTWDGETARAYINGVLAGAEARYDGTDPVPPDVVRLFIGIYDEHGRYPWRGVIDEIRVWSIVRSGTEIQAYMGVPLRGDEPGLVGYWRLDEGTGQRLRSSAPDDIPLRLGFSEGADFQDPEWVKGDIPRVYSPRGWIALDSEAYTCTDSATVEIIDSHLSAETVWPVTLSTTGGDTETVELSAFAADLGIFAGTVAIRGDPAQPEDGTLQVSDGAVVNATYADADDGTGSPGIASATAAVDCVPPLISNLNVPFIGDRLADVFFETNESSFAVVRFGTRCSQLTRVAASDFAMHATHTARLLGLDPGVAYYFVAEASDAVGNLARADNSGNCFRFRTKEREDSFLSYLGGDFVEGDYHPAFDFRANNQFTVEAWVYRGASGGNILSFPEETPLRIGIPLFGGNLGIHLVTHEAEFDLEAPGGAFPQQTWVHLAVTHDGETLTAYVDGIAVASRGVRGLVLPPSAGITLGKGSTYPYSVAWRGGIDEARIWSVARSPDEILTFMNRTLSGREPGLVAYWNLDDASGQVVRDLTPRRIDLRLGSSPQMDDQDPSWVTRVAHVEPPSPSTVDDLSCRINLNLFPPGSDPEVFFRWFRNRFLIQDPIVWDGQVFPATGAVLSQHFTTKNDILSSKVFSEADGQPYPSQMAQALPVRVIDSTPTAPVVHIIPETPIATDSLMAFFPHYSADLDGDEIAHTVHWLRSRDSGASFDLVPELNWVTVPAGYLSEGDVWRVEVLPFQVGPPNVPGELGWDQVYVGTDTRPVVQVLAPSVDTVALPAVSILWSATDADGDPITVDLYYDTDRTEGGALPIASREASSGSLTWVPPGASDAVLSPDLDGDGEITPSDLFLLASRWHEAAAGDRYVIFARAWAKGTTGEAFSPGSIIVPANYPADTEGLLKMLREWPTIR